MPGFIGPTELIVFLAVALLVLGPKRLPEMGRSLGKGMREFKNSVSGENHDELDVKTLVVTDDEASEIVVDTTREAKVSQ